MIRVSIVQIHVGPQYISAKDSKKLGSFLFYILAMKVAINCFVN